MLLVMAPDQRAGDLAIGAMHAPAEGRVEFSAPPEPYSNGPVAAAGLKALFKSAKAAPVGKVAADELAWLRTWLKAFGIEWVIVHRIERIPPMLILELSATIDEGGAQLVGVADEMWIPFLEEHLTLEDADTMTFEALQSMLATTGTTICPSTPDPVAVIAARMEQLALGNGLMSRMDDLAKERYPLYLAGFAAGAAIERPSRPTAAILASAMRRILEGVSDPACLYPMVKGIAVAQRPYGWDVIIDRRAIAIGPQPSAVGTAPPAGFRAFWIFKDALRGAAWTLMSLPITTGEAFDVRLEDVVGDGSAVSIQGEWFEIPDDARPLLRAALIEHEFRGAAADTPLLARADGRPRTDQWLLKIVTAAAAEAGVRVLDDKLRLRPSSDERWLLDRGVSLRWLIRGSRLQRSETPVDLDHRGRQLREAIARRPPMPACDCERGHSLPTTTEIPAWPPVPARAHVPYDTGVRRNRFRPHPPTRMSH